MKNLYALFLILVSIQAYGQCVPDPQYANANGGIYPNNAVFLANSFAVSGNNYSETLTLKTTTDTSVTAGSVSALFYLDGGKILDVTGAPAGFSFSGGGTTFEAGDPRPDFGQSSVDSMWWNIYGTPNDATTLQPVQGCIQISATASSVTAAAPAFGFTDYSIGIRLDARIAATVPPDLSSIGINDGDFLSENPGAFPIPYIVNYVLRVYASVPPPIPSCTDLFMSEYINGSGNNRALELYNPTSLPIDLSNYQVGRFRDGGSTPMLVPLSGTIQPNDTYVIALDKRDPNGTGFEEPIDPALEAVADTFVNPVYVLSNSPFYFNGDDAVVLTDQSGTELVDLIGKIGEDPGSAWTNDVSAGFTDANGGTLWTKDKTLIRKAYVTDGVTTNPILFNPTVEWDSLPVNTFSELGFHTCDCANLCPPTYSTNTVTACNSYSWNSITYNQSGTYTFQTTNSSGCDSIATLELTILPNYTQNQSYVLCGGQPVTVGGATYSQEGQYTQTIPGNGCDTIVTINITEEQAPSVTILGNTQISANSTETYAIVQPQGYTITWSVVNGTILSGQGTVSATIFWDASGGGEVSVMLSNNNCSYTYTMAVGTFVSIENHWSNNLQVHPNPSPGLFNLKLVEEAEVSVFDFQGRLIQQFLCSGPCILDLSGQRSGSYIIRLQTESTVINKRIIRL